MHALRSLLFATAVALLTPSVALAADRTFDAGSLVIPMDLSYQDRGMFQAYGLIYQLLAHGVHVHWVIDPNKTWHAADCDTPADLCAWDCDIEGSGVKCGYPTASPDMTATTNVVWDDKGAAARDSTLGTHKYRGGPFVIDAAERSTALAIIDAWNDKAKWGANAWATRDVFHVVTVHEATAAFTANSAREMIASPTIAVFADGNENIATGYLRAAGIPQSNGAEFLEAKCGAANCGPGTANPDMLTEEQIAGDLGLCSAPNNDHKNGALWKSDGSPAYCQIMSMHWDVNKREEVKCDDGACPDMQSQCGPTEKFTFNGHEVVAEVRAFLAYPTHFFAECQAVNAYENMVPNPAWPYLDDPGRDGHFLTTTGVPPACSGNTCGTNYECVDDGCGVGMNCCLPTPATWQNLPGFEVATSPTTVKVLSPHVPYNQLDGAFGPVGGSEPAYNLSTFLNTQYKNNRQVTLLTGPNGPGNQDLWMTGYLDGCGDIILGPPGGAPRALGCEGKISYLGGHSFKTDVPVTSGGDMQGTRLFLNALFEAQCTVAPDSGGGLDTDGDGVDDGADSDPNDPSKCGDIDGDGCDDCASGSFNLEIDCAPHGDGNPATGSSDGCCDTRTASSGGLRHALFAFVVGVLMLRRRRRR